MEQSDMYLRTFSAGFILGFLTALPHRFMNSDEEVDRLHKRCAELETELRRVRCEQDIRESQATTIPTKKKKKRKKKKNAHVAPATVPVLSAVTSADQRIEEFHALKQIYLEDLLECTSVDGVPQEFNIFLKPIQSQPVYCSLYLHVKFRPGYPAQAPEFTLRNLLNVSPDEEAKMIAVVRRIAEEKSKQHTEIIHAVCLSLSDSLDSLNAHQVSLKPVLASPKLIPAEDPEETKERKTSSEDMTSRVRLDVESRNKPKELLIIPHSDSKLLESKLQSYRPELVPNRSTSRFSDEYCNVSEVGKGGGGAVYRAVDRIERKVYAIKQIKLKHRSQVKIRKLVKEVVLLSELYHEHIVRYYYSWIEEIQESDSSSEEGEEQFEDSGSSSSPSLSSESSNKIQFEGSSDENSDASDDSDKPVRKRNENLHYLYIKMEFCEGETLKAILDKETLPEPSERWRMFRETLDGLSYMHSKSLVHRDLKPANIFLDSEQRIKIGDFGLATIRRRQVSTPGSRDEPAAQSSGSHGAGTPLYMSPEQLSESDSSEKSDMYSLGLIFFEMWRHFDSAMQHYEEFQMLRTMGKLPVDFLETTPKPVIDAILWLTKLNPADRPKAREMLFSDLLPHRFENQLVEDFIHTVLNPNTFEREWVLDALFNKQENPAEVDFSFSISKAPGNDNQANTRRLVKLQSLVENSIVNRFKSIFESAGAVNISAPLISPYYDYVKILEQLPNGQRELTPVRTEAMSRNCTVTYMESTGVLVALPNNSVVPWARMLSRKNLGGILKRYCFSQVFLPAGGREQPKQSMEASFDICSEESLEVHSKIQMEAEVIKVAYESLQSLASELPMYDVHFNSSRIVDGLLTMLEVPKHLKTYVLQALLNLHRKRWTAVKSELEDLDLTPPTIEALGTYMKQKGDVKVLQDYLRSKTGKNYALFRSELLALEQLVDACVNLKIPRDRLVFDLSVIADGLLCYSGLMFKVLARDRGVARLFATGGRYDNLIQHYEYPDKDQSMFDSRPVRMAGVGMWVKVDYLVDLVLRMNASNHITIPTCLTSPVVCVTSTCHHDEDKGRMLRERAAYCVELWRLGVSAVYMYIEIPMESAVSYCHRYRIRFLVNLQYTKVENLEDENYKEITASYQDFQTKKQYEKEMDKSDLARSVFADLKSVGSQN